MSNSLDPNQARHFVRPDLVPNCLQTLSADETNSFYNLPQIRHDKMSGLTCVQIVCKHYQQTILAHLFYILPLIRHDKMSGLICIQTVCKGYQQTTMAHFKNILPTLVKSMAMKKRSMSVVSDPHLRSNLKNNMVKPRIMCCFGVFENANLSSFIPHITTTNGPKLKYNIQCH